MLTLNWFDMTQLTHIAKCGVRFVKVWIDWCFLYAVSAAYVIFMARIFFFFNSDSNFTQYVKAHNQFVSIETYEIKILDIS